MVTLGRDLEAQCLKGTFSLHKTPLMKRAAAGDTLANLFKDADRLGWTELRIIRLFEGGFMGIPPGRPLFPRWTATSEEVAETGVFEAEARRDSLGWTRGHTDTGGSQNEATTD